MPIPQHVTLPTPLPQQSFLQATMEVMAWGFTIAAVTLVTSLVLTLFWANRFANEDMGNEDET